MPSLIFRPSVKEVDHFSLLCLNVIRSEGIIRSRSNRVLNWHPSCAGVKKSLHKQSSNQLNHCLVEHRFTLHQRLFTIFGLPSLCHGSFIRRVLCDAQLQRFIRGIGLVEKWKAGRREEGRVCRHYPRPDLQACCLTCLPSLLRGRGPSIL